MQAALSPTVRCSLFPHCPWHIAWGTGVLGNNLGHKRISNIFK
jgi:hypothetical protein